MPELLYHLRERSSGIAPQGDLIQRGAGIAARKGRKQERELAVAFDSALVAGKDLGPVGHQGPSEKLSGGSMSLIRETPRYLLEKRYG